MECAPPPPPPPPPPQPKQNYLIIPCYVEEEERCYEIYIIPVSDLGRKWYPTAQLKPKLVITCCEFGWHLCVVGTTIYMFNSNSYRNTAFDLSHILDDDDDDNERVVFLKEDMVRDISPMRYPKRNVKLVPTPAGKILAFSMTIYFRHSNGEEVVGDFELYDPENDSWEDIPQIPQSMSITCSAFIDDSTFLIQADFGPHNRLTYHLILGDGYSRWVRRDGLGGPLPFGLFCLRGQLCLTPSLVLDVKNVSKRHAEVCHFPSAFDWYAYPAETWSQTILYDKRSACCFLLQTAQHDESGDHFLAIHVYYLDVVKYIKQKVRKETKYLEQKKMLDEPYRGSYLWEFTNYRISNDYRKPRLPPCVPQLGHSLLSSTMLCLSPGRSSPRTLTDSFIA